MMGWNKTFFYDPHFGIEKIMNRSIDKATVILNGTANNKVKVEWILS